MLLELLAEGLDLLGDGGAALGDGEALAAEVLAALGVVLLGAALGGVTGAILGRNSSHGGAIALGGAAAAGLAGFVADAMVDVNNYVMITDVQLSEKIDGTISEVGAIHLNDNYKEGKISMTTSTETSNWKKHHTRIVSTAKKVNLKYEDAAEDLRKGLINSLSGIL